ncbi:MAG: ethanolamine utilization protein EutP [Clostridia bacterium]|nr:ethanolamine utilization protein EutP [Clostridia bacterium]
MKKIILMGKSGSGKTTLIEALRGEELVYRKTQYIDYSDAFMDTPGEYAEGNDLGGALAVYSYEADVVGLVLSATDDFCVFPPACAPVANRPVVGVVTKCDHADARHDLAAMRLELCGCERIFYTSARERVGVDELLAYLKE